MHFKEFSFMVFVIDAQVAGISGDMLLSSLVNIGANKSKIIDGIHNAESLCKDVKVKKIDFVEMKKNECRKQQKSVNKIWLKLDFYVKSQSSS